MLIRADQHGKQQTLPDASVFLEGGWFPPEQPGVFDVSSSIIEVDPRIDQVIAQSSPCIRSQKCMFSYVFSVSS